MRKFSDLLLILRFKNFHDSATSSHRRAKRHRANNKILLFFTEEGMLRIKLTEPRDSHLDSSVLVATLLDG